MITLHPIEGIPLVKAGDDVCGLILQASRERSFVFERGDVLVITQKIVSKADGLFVDLATVRPGARAQEIAAIHGGDPRYIEVILGESASVVVVRPNLLITQHVSGAVMANAGVDRSNVESPSGQEIVIVLPRDPDAAACHLLEAFRARLGFEIAIVLSDSWGRPWRLGTTGGALGAAGIATLRDLRGMPDLFGAPLRHSMQAVGDELAAAANLVMGQAAEAVPAVVVRGFAFEGGDAGARALQRPREQDVFR
ncbi:MAG: coenzyme F420-0:L-glutamate ligase [Hyphomonadaceae bacterium]|nr:coenzyme F420-0:L-glutamate ligase [Hyphomonadaceae bacterium]